MTPATLWVGDVDTDGGRLFGHAQLQMTMRPALRAADPVIRDATHVSTTPTRSAFA